MYPFDFFFIELARTANRVSPMDAYDTLVIFQFLLRREIPQCWSIRHFLCSSSVKQINNATIV
jgi:hypothetical protein